LKKGANTDSASSTSPEFGHIRMTDAGVYTCHHFIKRLGSSQAEPLNLDFSYHLESPAWRTQWQEHPVSTCNCSAGLDEKLSQPN
jgi:hypothetical protein